MQRKRFCASESLHAMPVMNIRRRIWSSLFLVIRIVESRPFLFVLVPPDEFFPLAPRLAIRPRRRPVVNDAAVVRPGEAPAVAEQVFWLSFIGAISIFFRENAAIDPRSAGGRPVIFQVLNVAQLLAILPAI